MALTGTDRGVGGNNASSTSIACVPTSTLAAGSTGVLCVAGDNAGSGGATSIWPTSFTDSVGNLWTRRQNPIYDPGAANAGVDTACYTAPIVTQLTSSNNATINFVAGVAVVAKRFAFHQVSAGAGNAVVYVTGAAGTGAASGTPTVTTSS